MKLQAHNVSLPRQNRRQKRNQKSWIIKFYILLYILVAVTVAAGVAIYRVDLNRKINDIYRQSQRTQREIHELERDIQALKVAKQSLASWENVSRQIAHHKLSLQATTHRQVRYFTVQSSRHGQYQNGEFRTGSNAVSRLSKATY